MRKRRSYQYASLLVLLAVSLFTLTPAQADQIPSQVGTITFHLTGRATSMNTTVDSLGPAILDLIGGGLGDGQGGLMIQNLTGNLQIGSANYSIFTGDGKSDGLGELVMIGQSSSGDLVLHGKIQNNNTVTTDAPPSRLSSLAYLALSGSMTLSDATNSPEVNLELDQNVTSTVENATTANTIVNSSITQSASSSSSTTVFTSQTQVSTVDTTMSGSSNQIQPGTVAFHLTGQATSTNSTLGSLGLAILDLTGEIHGDGQGGLVIENLTGNLQIGPANYPISTGSGNSNRLGLFAIFGQSTSGELILHGTIQNNSTVTTDGPPSRLSTLAYLPLSGSVTINNAAIGSAMSVQFTQNVTRIVENSTSVNSTSAAQSGSSSSTANFTTHTEVSTENTTMSPTVAYALPGQNNTTVTTTQFNNQTVTVYVSNTVANNAITQTTTTTVANTTITQFSSITTSNATVTVTNSTTSGS